MVPVSEWRIPNQAEKELLIGWPSVNQSGGWIALLELPEKLISPFHIARSITRNAKRREEVLEIWTENARVAKAEFDHFIREQLGPGSSQDSTLQLSGGIRVNDPQMPTVTVHPNTKRLVGLHVDDWYSQNLEYRHQSPNRISINLGVQDRFFLFVNLPILEIARAIRDDRREPRPSLTSCTLLGRKFLMANPGYPVVKLRVRPGQAYIAPTENMIHDGTTCGMTVPDVALSLHGEMTLLEPILEHRRFTSLLTRLE